MLITFAPIEVVCETETGGAGNVDPGFCPVMIGRIAGRIAGRITGRIAGIITDALSSFFSFLSLK